ncbi:MAG: hypothetical protein FWH07_08370, partial [Oscillospiraceae bacterium]|nr:hypothetical protein [Oscillospiraceae bacterium]
QKPPKNQSATTFEPLTTTQIPDDKILEMARKFKDGGAFDKLYSGDWQGAYKSQSEADFALCCKLAFWTGKVESQMDRLFRQSGLMREKWEIVYSDGLTTVRKRFLMLVRILPRPIRRKRPSLKKILMLARFSSRTANTARLLG